MPSVKKIYGKKMRQYMKAEDLLVPTVLTITATESDDKFGEEQIVLTFREHEKKLRLNQTNSNTLSEQWGDASEGWVGKVARYAAVPVIVRGEEKMGIRVVGFVA